MEIATNKSQSYLNFPFDCLYIYKPYSEVLERRSNYPQRSGQYFYYSYLIIILPYLNLEVVLYYFAEGCKQAERGPFYFREEPIDRRPESQTQKVDFDHKRRHPLRGAHKAHITMRKVGANFQKMNLEVQILDRQEDVMVTGGCRCRIKDLESRLTKSEIKT